MKKTKLVFGSIVAAILAALAIFVVMLQTEKNELSKFEKETVYRAKVEIPKGKKINENNMSSYLEPVEIDKKLVGLKSCTTAQTVENMLAIYDIEPGTLLDLSMFMVEKESIKNLKNPVVAGLKGDDLFQLCGGILRAGDLVDLYIVREDGSVELAFEKIRIQQVFDSSGNIIEQDINPGSASRINVYLDSSRVQEFYEKLASGSLRLVKIWN